MNQRPFLLPVALVGCCVALVSTAESHAAPSLLTGRVVESASASGDSRDPVLSDDGRVVVFTSTAPDLVAGDANGRGMDVFARELPGGAVERVSVNREGRSGNGPSYGPAVSADGRYVAFTSEASDLVEGDVNGVADVFVRDRSRGTTVLAGVPHPDAGDIVRPAVNPILSADGRFLVFQSRGSNRATHLHLRDLEAGVTTWIDRPAPGLASDAGATEAEASADASRVVFRSSSTNLAPFPRNNRTDVFVFDRRAGTNRVADLLPSTVFGSPRIGTIVRGYSLSSDGRWLVAQVEFPEGEGRLSRYVRLDLDSGVLEILHQDVAGGDQALLLGRAPAPRVADDGSWSAFELVPRGGRMAPQPAVYLGAPGARPILVSANEANADAPVRRQAYGRLLALSGNGDVVAYQAPEIPPAGTTNNGPLRLWLARRSTGEARRIEGTEGWSGGDDDMVVAFSKDGGRVAFHSGNPGLVAGDGNGARDVFLYDWTVGSIRLVSERRNDTVVRTALGPQGLSGPVFSGDGQWVAFVMGRPVEGDGAVADRNGFRDMVVQRLDGSGRRVASVRADGAETGDGMSWAPSLSHEGRYVAFLSTARNLVGGSGSGAANVYLRDLERGVTMLASRTNGTTLGAATDCMQPALSADGRWLAFVTDSGLLPGGMRGVLRLFVYDRETQELREATARPAVGTFGVRNSMNPGWLPGGGPLLYQSLGSTNAVWNGVLRWYTWDPVTGAREHLDDAGAGTSTLLKSGLASVSGDGSVIAFSQGVALANTLVRWRGPWTSSATIANSLLPRLDPDGRQVAYVHAGSPRELRVMSLGDGGITTPRLTRDGQGPSSPYTWFEFDATGRILFFATAATNVHPRAVRAGMQLFAHDLTAGTTLLLSAGNDGAPAGEGIAAPVLSSDRNRLMFATAAGNLADGDVNGYPDLYWVRVDGKEDGLVLVIGRAGAQGVRLRWATRAGAADRVEFTSDLGKGPWRPLGRPVVSEGAEATTDDPEAAPGEPRFYRLFRGAP